MTTTSVTLVTHIHRAASEVYEFVIDPHNLSRWADGLGRQVDRVDGGWIVHTPFGKAKVVFERRNDLGVADHWVTPLNADGVQQDTIYVPLRVLANGDGSEVLLTLFRQPHMTDEQYADDARMIQRDLDKLRDLLAR